MFTEVHRLRGGGGGGRGQWLVQDHDRVYASLVSRALGAQASRVTGPGMKFLLAEGLGFWIWHWGRGSRVRGCGLLNKICGGSFHP